MCKMGHSGMRHVLNEASFTSQPDQEGLRLDERRVSHEQSMHGTLTLEAIFFFKSSTFWRSTARGDSSMSDSTSFNFFSSVPLKDRTAAFFAAFRYTHTYMQPSHLSAMFPLFTDHRCFGFCCFRSQDRPREVATQTSLWEDLAFWL